MNEAISADAITIYEEVQTYEPVSLTGEAAENLHSFPRLDGEVMPLVAANEHVIAPCRWMGGAEVTLTTAMINYPELMTEENADQILADIREFLASQRIEREILDEELDAEEEDVPEKERPEPEEKAAKPEKRLARKAETDNKIKNEIEVRELQPEEQTADSASRPAAEDQKIEPTEVTQKPPEEPTSSLVGRPAAVKPAKNELMKLSPGTVGMEAETENSADPQNETSPGNDAPFEAMPEVGINMEAVPVRQMSVLGSREPALAGATVLKSGPMPANLRPDEEQTEEYLNIAEAAEAAAGPEPAEWPALEPEDVFLMDEMVELADEKVEATSEAPTLEFFEYTTDVEGDLVFEVEDLTGNPGFGPEQSEPATSPEFIEVQDSTMEEASLARQYNELFHPVQAETASPEQPVQITLPIAEVEDSLTRLAEHIEEVGPEEAEAAAEVLDRIIEVIAKPGSAEDNFFTEEEALDELEELFTELFQITGTVYTPGLIESLARFAVQIPPPAEVEKQRDTDQALSTSTDRATHEIIRELLVCMNTSKKVVTNAWAIGKSALRLYSFSF